MDLGVVDETLPKLTEYKIMGASAAVIKDGSLVYFASAGVLDSETGNKVKPNSLFQAASLSKLINAIGMLKLVDKGLIKLGDDIRDFVGAMSVPADPSHNSKPSIRRILRHHAGISQSGFNGYRSHINPLPTLNQIISGANNANHDAIVFNEVPGKAYNYSGGGTTLLQKALEVVTGETYQTWMKREVLMPLGMYRSTFDLRPPGGSANDVGIASGHKASGQVWPGKRNNYPESAAAGLYSTAIDLSQAIKLINGRGVIDGRVFLPSSLIDKMLNRGQTANVGLGCFLSSSGVWNHEGSNKGFRCKIEGHPTNKSGLILLTNTDDSDRMNDYFRVLKRTHSL